MTRRALRRRRARVLGVVVLSVGAAAGCNVLTGMSDDYKLVECGGDCGADVGSPETSSSDGAVDGGQDVTPRGDAACTEGTSRCEDGKVVTCSGGSLVTTSCSSGTFCFEGACVTNRSCHGEAGAAPACGEAGTDDCCATGAVPGGSFRRSYDGVYATDAGNFAFLSAFELDDYEITVARFRAFVHARDENDGGLAGMGTQMHPPDVGSGASGISSGFTGWQSEFTTHLAPSTAALETALACDPTANYSPDPGHNDDRPMNCLSFYDALAFCIWDGGRLPTDAEWNYAAAGGDEQRVFPWSVPASDTTFDDQHAAWRCIPVPAGGCLEALVRPGLLSAGRGKWGQYDLSGNVTEWTLDPFCDFGACTNCVDTCPANTTARALRSEPLGGSTSASGFVVSARNPGDPTARYPDTGARCARK